MDEEAHRRQTGRADHAIVFRLDHGHELLSDIGRGTHPGYPIIGWDAWAFKITRHFACAETSAEHVRPDSTTNHCGFRIVVDQ